MSIEGLHVSGAGQVRWSTAETVIHEVVMSTKEE